MSSHCPSPVRVRDFLSWLVWTWRTRCCTQVRQEKTWKLWDLRTWHLVFASLMIWTWPVFTSTFFSLVRVWVRSCISGRLTAWRAIKWLKKRDHSNSSTHGRTTWMEQVLWIPAWFTEVRKADQEPQRQCFLGVKQRTSSGHWCEFVCDGSRSNSRTGFGIWNAVKTTLGRLTDSSSWECPLRT